MLTLSYSVWYVRNIRICVPQINNLSNRLRMELKLIYLILTVIENLGCFVKTLNSYTG